MSHFGTDQGKGKGSTGQAGRSSPAEPTFRSSLPELRSAISRPMWWFGLVFQMSVLAAPWGAVQELVLGRSAVDACVSGLSYGILVGAIQVAIAPWQQMKREPLPYLSREKARQARLASARGPVPDDLQVRAAALGVAERRSSLGKNRWYVAFGLVFVLAALALSVVLAVAGTPVWWGTTAILGTAVALAPKSRRARRARIAELSAAPGAES